MSRAGSRISGRKIYSTGAPGLTWFETFCRTDELKPRVGPFLVRAGSDGLRIEEGWDHLGLRASGSHDVVLDDVFVPDEQVGALTVPGEGPPPRTRCCTIRGSTACVRTSSARPGSFDLHHSAPDANCMAAKFTVHPEQLVA